MFERTRWLAILIGVAAMATTSCGASEPSDDAVAAETAPAATDAVDAVDGSTTEDGEASASNEAGDMNGDGQAATTSGGGGTMVLDDQTIVLDSSRCYLEEQDSAAGGGKILFVVQATGTDANGDDVLIDISRYDEDSMFAGDAISVVFGDPFAGGDSSWDASAESGTVTLDGTNASADALTFVNMDDLSEAAGSFDIDC